MLKVEGGGWRVQCLTSSYGVDSLTLMTVEEDVRGNREG